MNHRLHALMSGHFRMTRLGFAFLLVFLFSWPAAVEAASVTLKIGGTGSALASMRLLADVFEQSRHDVDIVVLPSLGSGGGIRALRAGAIDIALSARPLKPRERKGDDSPLIEVEYARTPLVFVTHPNIDVDNITLPEAAATMSGEAETWPNGVPRRLVLRPRTESDNKVLRSLSEDMDRAVEAALTKPGMTFAVNDQDNADALETVEGAFGAMTLGQLLAEKRRLKALNLDGVQPAPESLAAGSYPMFKRLYFITDSAKATQAAEFVTFLHSSEAKDLLLAYGHLPTIGD